MAFFRSGGSPDRLGWRLLGQWSGHWLAFPVLARRALTTLVAFAYFWRLALLFGSSAMSMKSDLTMPILSLRLSCR